MLGSPGEPLRRTMPAGIRPLQLPLQQPLPAPSQPLQYGTTVQTEAVGHVLTSHHITPVSRCVPAVAGRPVIRRVVSSSRSTIGSTNPPAMAGWVQVPLPMPLSARATLGATPAPVSPPLDPKPRALSTDTIRGHPMSASGLSGSTCASVSGVGLLNPPAPISRAYSAASASEQILLPHRTAARLEEEAAEAKQLCRRLSEDLEGLNKRHQEALDEAAKLAREKAAALTSVRELHRAVELLEKENQLLRQALHGTLRNSFDLSSLLGAAKASEFDQKNIATMADGKNCPHPRESPRRSKDNLAGEKAPSSTLSSTTLAASPAESVASSTAEGHGGPQWRRGSSVNLPLERIRIAPPRPEMSGSLQKLDQHSQETQDVAGVDVDAPGVAAVIWRPTRRSEGRRG